MLACRDAIWRLDCAWVTTWHLSITKWFKSFVLFNKWISLEEQLLSDVWHYIVRVTYQLNVYESKELWIKGSYWVQTMHSLWGFIHTQSVGSSMGFLWWLHESWCCLHAMNQLCRYTHSWASLKKQGRVVYPSWHAKMSNQLYLWSWYCMHEFYSWFDNYTIHVLWYIWILQLYAIVNVVMKQLFDSLDICSTMSRYPVFVENEYMHECSWLQKINYMVHKFSCWWYWYQLSIVQDVFFAHIYMQGSECWWNLTLDGTRKSKRQLTENDVRLETSEVHGAPQPYPDYANHIIQQQPSNSHECKVHKEMLLFMRNY